MFLPTQPTIFVFVLAILTLAKTRGFASACQPSRQQVRPIMGPLQDGVPDPSHDPPSNEEVMRELERAQPLDDGVQGLYEVQRKKRRMIKEKITDYVDPPRIMPSIGPVQLHHVEYKCKIDFSETAYLKWPVPLSMRTEDGHDTIYIDRRHFHRIDQPKQNPMMSKQRKFTPQPESGSGARFKSIRSKNLQKSV